jgi:hypothetical protein
MKTSYEIKIKTPYENFKLTDFSKQKCTFIQIKNHSDGDNKSNCK